MSELPLGWTNATLREVSQSIVTGKRPKGGVRGIFRGVLSLGGEHVSTEGHVDLSTPRFVPEEFAASIADARVARDDVLVVKDGATTGKVAIADARFDDKEAYVNEHVFLCRVAKPIEPQLVYFFLRSDNGRQLILSDFRGAAQGGISRGFSHKVVLPIPPLSEQRRIVAKIDSLTGKSRRARDHLDHIPRLVEKYKHAVLAAAFRGDLTAAWRARKPERVATDDLALMLDTGRRHRWLREAHRKAKLRGREVSDQVLLKSYQAFDKPGLNPLHHPGWYRAKLGAFALVLGGKRLEKGTGYEEGATPHPYIRVTDFAGGALDPSGLRHISPDAHKPIAQYCVEVDDVCISIAGTIGATFVVPVEVNGANLTENAARLAVAACVLPNYLDLFLKSAEGQSQISEATVATGQPKLALFRIEQLAVPLTSEGEQREIVRRVHWMMNWIDRLSAEATNARKLIERLDQAALAKAFRGELVPQDPADEPASVLLDRIMAERGPALSKGGRRAGE